MTISVRKAVWIISAAVAASSSAASTEGIDRSFGATLQRYNKCMGRDEEPTGWHVWNGAHGHYEV